MKAITLPQPLATFTALGIKTMETRPWSTSHRGFLAIHAAETASRVTDPYHRTLLREAGLDPEKLPLGMVLAAGRLVACRRLTPADTPCYPQYAFSEFRPGQYLLEFADVTPLVPPIPACGHEDIWDWMVPPAMVPFLSAL